MLRTSVFLTLSALAFAGAATAQQAAPKAAPQAAPQAAPPQQGEPIEKGREPELIPERPVEPRTKIRERKQGGVVQEATVTSGGSTYTLRPARPAGNAASGSVEAGPSRAPTWNVLDFDLGKKKKKPQEGATAEGDTEKAAAEAPPVPNSAPVK